MTGVALQFTSPDARRIADSMAAVMRMRPEKATPMLGALVESQTRKRLATEKRAPDGTEWPEWSEAYAETRHRGQSLLEAEGGLIDSIESVVTGGDAEVGSALVYAAIHQKGGAGAGRPEIPERAWLGLSDDNLDEIEAAMTSFVDAELVRLVR